MVNDSQTKIYTNARNPESNPCIKEGDLSLKCLSNNNYERNKCLKYFENYNNCVRFWNKIMDERKRNFIKPHLPPQEERAEIMAARRGKSQSRNE